jgi:hypothetical protein
MTRSLPDPPPKYQEPAPSEPPASAAAPIAQPPLPDSPDEIPELAAALADLKTRIETKRSALAAASAGAADAHEVQGLQDELDALLVLAEELAERITRAVDHFEPRMNR